MQPRVQIWLDGIQRYEDCLRLEMTVFNGAASEQLSLPVAEETALTLESILREEPFSPTKLGSYRREVQEISEGSGLPKTLVVQISKGRSRVKRSVAVGQELFLMLWNILHFSVLPSQLPFQRRQN